jgi:glucokinase
MIPVIQQHKIDRIILGGNISRTFPLFSREVLAVFQGNQINAEIKISALKEHAALIGAASCCKHLALDKPSKI